MLVHSVLVEHRMTLCLWRCSLSCCLNYDSRSSLKSGIFKFLTRINYRKVHILDFGNRKGTVWNGF